MEHECCGHEYINSLTPPEVVFTQILFLNTFDEGLSYTVPMVYNHGQLYVSVSQMISL